jgi:hypothetical protein
MDGDPRLHGAGAAVVAKVVQAGVGHGGGGLGRAVDALTDVRANAERFQEVVDLGDAGDGTAGARRARVRFPARAAAVRRRAGEREQGDHCRARQNYPF